MSVRIVSPAARLIRNGQQWGKAWAGNLAVNDPEVSPLYGSLSGLPPTYVYSGSMDLLAPDVLVLQQEAVAAGAPMSSYWPTAKFTTGLSSPRTVPNTGHRSTGNSVFNRSLRASQAAAIWLIATDFTSRFETRQS